MQPIIYLLLTQSVIHTTRATTIRIEKAKQIERLENEKQELFKQINDGIDESVKYLQKANDSTSIVGISYIKDLKEQIKELNGTSDDGNDGDRKEEDTETKELKGFRRYGMGVANNETRRQEGEDYPILWLKGSGKHDLFDEKNLFENKKKSKKWKQRYENRIKMQNKLNDWLAQREAEKVKIKKYREQAKRGGNTERCPRQGIKGTSLKGKDKKSKSKFSGRYPCCRKCCKRSYMGCL